MIPQYKLRRLLDHLDETLLHLEWLGDYVPSKSADVHDVLMKCVKDVKAYVEANDFRLFNDASDSFRSDAQGGGMIDRFFDEVYEGFSRDRAASQDYSYSTYRQEEFDAAMSHFNSAVDAWTQAQAICQFMIQDTFG